MTGRPQTANIDPGIRFNLTYSHIATGNVKHMILFGILQH